MSDLVSITQWNGDRAMDSAYTRTRILNACARLFRTRGYRGTTIRAISEQVGILSGSLFHHFSSKQQMLLEIMRSAAESMCTRARDEVAAASTPRGRLRALIHLQLDCLLGENTKDFYAVLVSEWRELDNTSKPPLTTLRRRYFRIWQDVLEQCEREGLLRAEPVATVFALHGAINWASTWFKPTGRLSLEDYATLLERIVLELSVAHIAHAEQHAKELPTTRRVSGAHGSQSKRSRSRLTRV